MVRPLGAGEFGLGEVVVLYVYSKSSNRVEVYPKKCHPIWNCTNGDYWIVVTNPKLLKNCPIARNLS